jgi:peptidoglycan hydrolase-like protein with peptidoglycan-binding domain
VASVQPATGSDDLAPRQPLTVTLSRPVTSGSPSPSIAPNVPGSWSHPSAASYVFTPSAPYQPDTFLTVRVPGGKQGLAGRGGARLANDVTEHWRVRGGSTLRAQQILARLGYLPVSFDGAKPTSEAAEITAAYHPPDGSFSWRWHPAPGMSRLWAPGKRTVLLQGAITTYQHDRGLTVDGLVGHDTWQQLISDDLAGRQASRPFTYIAADLTQPQRLTLYANGTPVIKSPVNSGVAGARTPTGTWPIYARYTKKTMRGTNPDGSHYVDHDVPWDNFFYGGDAVHAFDRASFGSPQSVGCVELPLAAAAKVWPYMPIGTLVTIES